MDSPALSRSEAVRLGVPYYHTGKSCPRGHIDKRTAHRGECRQCHLEDAKAWQMRVKPWRMKRRPQLFRIRAEAT
jgi:hypothetical protein